MAMSYGMLHGNMYASGTRVIVGGIDNEIESSLGDQRVNSSLLYRVFCEYIRPHIISPVHM